MCQSSFGALGLIWLVPRQIRWTHNTWTFTLPIISFDLASWLVMHADNHTIKTEISYTIYVEVGVERDDNTGKVSSDSKNVKNFIQ